MKKLTSFFFTDIHWKIFSLFLAFLLWLIGSNFSNPLENTSINIQLETHNAEILANAGLVLLNPDALDELITVGVRAERRDLEALMEAGAAVQSSMVVPSVDFRAINTTAILEGDDPATVKLPISVNLYESLQHFSIAPRFVELEIDVLAHESFPVQVEILNEVAPTFERRPERVSTARVNVSGPRSYVERVDRVQVSIDVLGLYSDRDIEAPLVVLCQNGYDITAHLELSAREITVTIPVWPVEAVEIEVQSTGAVATGFAVAYYMTWPTRIEVTATPERLQGLEYLLVEVDLNNANATFTKTASVVLPDGVHLRSGESDNITVEIVIEPIERRRFSVPRDNVRILGMDANYDVLTALQFISVDVSGPRSAIAELTASEIGLELDLRRLPIGTHSVVLGVELPEGITLIQPSPRMQIQINDPAADDGNDNDNDNDFDHYHVDDPDPQDPIMPPDYYPSDNNENDNEIVADEYYEENDEL